MKLVAALLLFAVQDDPARDWIRKLGSESVEDREAAMQALLKLDRRILPTLRREQAAATDKETKGRIADLVERMAEIAIYAPGLTPRGAEVLKGALAGKDSETHVVVFTGLGKALDSKAELLALWLGGEVTEVDPPALERLKTRRVIGFDRLSAHVFESMGLEISASNCAVDEENAPRIKVEKSAVGLKNAPAETFVAFRREKNEEEKYINSILWIPRKSYQTAVVEVIARCGESAEHPWVPNYAPIVRQGNHLLVGLGGAPETWTPEFSAFMRDLARAMIARPIQPFAKARWELTRPGTYEFELADGNSTRECPDQQFFLRFSKPTPFKAVLKHSGSNNLMFSAGGPGFPRRKDAHGGEDLVHEAEITEAHLEKIGDGYWILRLANFDREHAARCTLTIEFKE